ncbi:MAG: peptidase, partial [Rheinheimera sp.]|nr:peptidase [Rheinheimera sp.]
MSSNFFSQQDLARRNTRLLVLLFSVAVLLLLLLTNVLALVSLGFIDPALLSSPAPWHALPWHLVLAVSLGVLVAVSLAVLVKWLQLQAGGKVVATALGGQRLAPDSKDTLQRRLLNVVEEMALAAGTPVPPVYLLPERSINAFAAGYSPADAVIGVTQG